MRDYVRIIFLMVVLFIGMPSNSSSVHGQEAPPETDPFLFIMEGESQIGNSKIAGEDSGTFSTVNRWLTSLAYRLDPQTLIATSYNGRFDISDLFIAQEEGDRKSDRFLSNNFAITVKKQITRSVVVRPVFFYDLVFIKDTDDESLGFGLYDYEDLGGGFRTTHTFNGSGEPRNEWYYGSSIFKRRYPHFKSLSCEFNQEGCIEKNEKDFLGYKFEMGRIRPLDDKWSSEWGLVWLFKNFTDKRTIDTNGIRENGKRDDWYQEARYILSRPIHKNMVFSLLSSVTLNLSNLDFYDTKNTTSLLDDEFMDGYFNTVSTTLSPALIFYKRTGSEANQVIRLTMAYSLDTLLYMERNALNLQGNQKEQEQRDVGHSFSAQLSYPLRTAVFWVARAQYKWQDSNQKFEDFYQYNYDLWSVTSGVSFEY